MALLHLSLRCVLVCVAVGVPLLQKSAKLLQNLTQQKGYKYFLLVEMVNSNLDYQCLS